MMRDNGWNMQATIEFEYPVPAAWSLSPRRSYAFCCHVRAGDSP